jgi:hypothetical protein
VLNLSSNAIQTGFFVLTHQNTGTNFAKLIIIALAVARRGVLALQLFDFRAIFSKAKIMTFFVQTHTSSVFSE